MGISLLQALAGQAALACSPRKQVELRPFGLILSKHENIATDFLLVYFRLLLVSINHASFIV
jgi:hypothetical protein